MSVLIPLSLAKKHLNIEDYFIDDDDYINSLIDISLYTIKDYCSQNWLDLDYTSLENSGKTESEYPLAIKQAVLLLIGNLYANREPVSFGSPVKIPYTLDFILQTYINYDYKYIKNK